MDKLRDLRIKKNINQKDIAKYLGIKQNSYSQYENGLRKVPTHIIIKLKEFYNINIDYLLNLTDTSKPYPKSNVIKIRYSMTRLKDIRENYDLTQEYIANILHMSQSAYSSYEVESGEIPIQRLIDLAIYYDVPIDYLLYLTDERKPYKRK